MEQKVVIVQSSPGREIITAGKCTFKNEGEVLAEQRVLASDQVRFYERQV